MSLSIVIPCYNHARFLTAALESALAQDAPAADVVVVDDGSTDETAAVARRYPVQLIQQPNRGLAAARNAGRAATRGDVIIFLDADDVLWPIAAKAALAHLAAHPAAGMVTGGCRVIDGAGAPVATNVPAIRNGHYEALLRDNFLWMPAMTAFRRAALDEVGVFDGRVNPTADYDMYLRVSRRFPVVSHDQIVADYRSHGGNMSADPIVMLEGTLRVLRAQEPHVRGDARLLQAYRDGLANCRRVYGERLVDRFRAALHRGDLGEAAIDAWHLMRLYPSGVRRHLRKKASVSLRPPDDAGGASLRTPTRPGARP